MCETMDKYRPYSRRVLRERSRAWLKRYVRVVAVCSLAAVALIGVECGLLLGLHRPGPLQWFLLGAISTSLIAALGVTFGAMFLITDEEAVRQIRGAWGEENTRDELQRASKHGEIWGWVDSLTVQGGDVDHIVISRNGGIVAIDSKWRTRVDAQGRNVMVRQALTARRRTEAVVRSVLDRQRRGRRADGTAFRVRTAVVIWGSAQADLPDNVSFDGVDFVRGRDFRGWLNDLKGDPVDQEPAEYLLTSLEHYREAAWASTVSSKSS